jgi:hypothetical protein
MRILFFPPTREIDLSGDQDDLTALAALVASASGTLSSEAGPENPSGQIVLTCVRVQTTETMVLFKGDPDTRSLIITGSPEHLRILAENLTEMAQADDGGHQHIEHWPDHFYLAEGSHPLVVNSPHGAMPPR